ncbi:MAG TPA: hypothetical protein VK550_01310 [Polyangiaceae bacterium]|nr:hypothetical protein [Polyangiaceae bacterium]
MHGLGHGKLALALCLLGLSQSGCDIVQGFRDASAAVFPDEKTYFDAPGFRLVRGEYRDLEFASGSSLYLLARPADRDDDSLYVMRYADPRPCVLNHVKWHVPGVGVFLDATTIAYTEEGTDEGTLRFADGDCHTYPMSIPDSRLYRIETAEGFVVKQGLGLAMVNPVTGANRTIVSDGVLVGGFAYFYVIYSQAQGKIGAFRADWKEVGWFGNGVDQRVGVGSSYFYHDAAGVHRLVAASTESVTDTVIAAKGCNLELTQNLGVAENWVTYYSPCESKKLVAYGESAGHASELDIPTAPGHLAFLPAYPNQSGDPAVDPFYIFYLTDVDGSVGQLVLRTPERQTKVIGQRAAFERLSVFSSAEETHGYALVDVEGDLGRFVRWDTDGSTLGIAQGVVRGNGDLVTDFDGSTGKFALLSESGLSTISKRVPSSGFKMRDGKNRWTAIIDDFKDQKATLSITESTLDFSEAARTPAPDPELKVIDHDVLWDYRAQFVPALPGIAYLTHYDPEKDIGRLEYRNLELQFTATISDGVATYLATPGGLIYSVPLGDGAGIWVVRSR